jgi:HlyD family secretion protein
LPIGPLQSNIMSDTSSSASRQKSRGSVIFVACFLCSLLLVAAWVLMIPRAVIVRGEMEATQVDLAIKVIGRLQDKKVRIGDRIRRGDQLLTLVNPDLEAKLVQAMAASNIAEVEMQKLLIETRAEEIEQLKIWNRAKAISEQARRNSGRAKKTQASGSVPLGQTFESLQRPHNSEEAAGAIYEKAMAGNRQEEKDAAVARAVQARAVVLELQENARELNVIAPIDGEVSQINIDRGELASPGATLISLIDLIDIWVTANLREDLLVRLRMGESFKGKVPALGNQEVEFNITSISPLEDFATSHAARASGGLEFKTFKVRAVPAQPVEGLRPGMSVLFEVPRQDFASAIWKFLSAFARDDL